MGTDSDTGTEATCAKALRQKEHVVKGATVALEQRRQAGEGSGCQTGHTWWFLGESSFYSPDSGKPLKGIKKTTASKNWGVAGFIVWGTLQSRIRSCQESSAHLKLRNRLGSQLKGTLLL